MRLLILILCASLAQAATLTITAVPTFENCGYYITGGTQGLTCHVYYRESGGEWKNAYAPYDDGSEYRGSIVGLTENTTYEIAAVTYNGASKTDTSSETLFTTWTDSPTILRTHNISSVHPWDDGALFDTTGTDEGWIRFLGDGTDTIDGGSSSWYGFSMFNCHYVIFENIHFVGGGRRAILLDNTSDHIRFINCTVSNWGRVPVSTDENGYYLDSDDEIIDLDYAMTFLDAEYIVVERCYIHHPNGRATTWVQPEQTRHAVGPMGMRVLLGKSVIRYNEIVGEENHWLADGISAQSAGLKEDCDVYGNVFAFCNDDAVELEDDAKNLRFYNNLITNVFSGISVRPLDVGPIYIFRNVLARHGDENGYLGNTGFKLASGAGMHYIFHNTFYMNGDILYGLSGELYCTVRNNMFVCFNEDETYAISDSYQSALSSYDYDLYWGKLTVPTGSEAHGVALPPAWVNSGDNVFTLQATSNGVDDGIVLNNFSDGYAGSKPDMGAFEIGGSTLIPPRPINIMADKYRVQTIGSYPQAVTLDVGSLSDSTYTVVKSDSMAWMTVTPSSGELTDNIDFTFLADTTKFMGATDSGIVFIRLANGYSVPIIVGATKAGGGPVGEDTIATVVTQPVNDTVFVGEPGQFSVEVIGTPVITYQWQMDTPFSDIDDESARHSSYTTVNTTVDYNGMPYRCIVTNSVGSDTSDVAILVVLSEKAAIVSDPVDKTAYTGQTAVFTVIATGTPAPTYQWQKNSVDIADATETSYTTPALVLGDSGNLYRCIASNVAGSDTSETATLTVRSAFSGQKRLLWRAP